MKKTLNFKQMCQTFDNYADSTESGIEIWDTYYKMKKLGFISDDEWNKFYEKYKDFEI